MPHNNDHSSEITAIDMSTPSSSGHTAVDAGPSSGKGQKDPQADIEQAENVENVKKRKGDREDGKHILQQDEAMDRLPYTWTPRKKWTILSVIFVVQCSMNCKSFG
jgi:hypothetical protein